MKQRDHPLVEIANDLFDVLLRNCQLAAGLFDLRTDSGVAQFREHIRPFYREWWIAGEKCNGRVGHFSEADSIVDESKSLIEFYSDLYAVASK